MSWTILGLLSTFAAPSATINIDARREGAPVSPTLWGIFFEEINHAGDGGLYAEMIRNRSFEETLPAEGTVLVDGRCIAPESPSYITGQLRRWSVPWRFPSDHPAWTLESREAAGAISLESEDPVHPSNVRYLRLRVDSLPAAGHLSLRNDGYWGVSVRQGAVYDLSLFARSPAAGALRVGVLGADGRVLAEATIDRLSPTWTRHAAVLRATGSDAKGSLFIEPQGPGTVDLDVVSLLPRETFGRPGNGIRRDLGELLAGLRPSFVRFPGGCVVEGATMANRYRWKETIGPQETRPGHWSLWGYRNTDGLGYHEFLQLCEDLGADGMYVANCGLSCEYRNGDFWPDERVDELIQDTLDAIEYALGPVDSEWGAKRAAAGHPAPLPLRYVEIGNENHGPRYIERYHRFAAAISAAWPEIELISNVRIDGAPIEDQHFYVQPSWFFDNAGRYDHAPREGASRVYVGEYACNQGVGSGNLLAGLSEAVFMMGMERNSDLVTMASYAPLFFHVEDINWPVNLIGFDNTTSFGRTSYWVQRLFAEHRPQVNVACEVASPDLESIAQPGRVGVGTWATQAEFRNLRVSRAGETLWSAERIDANTAVDRGPGRWEIVDGALRQSSDAEPATALVSAGAWADYTYELEARKLGGAEGFLIPFSQQGGEKSWWNLGGWANREHGLEVPGISLPHVPGRIETGRWYRIKIEVAGPRVRCWLDDQLIHDVTRRARPAVWAIAGRDGDELVVKVVNLAPTPLELSIAGLEPGRIEAWSLAADSLDAENSLAEPERVAPRRSIIADGRPVLAPHSLTVLRIAAESAPRPPRRR